MKNIRLIPRLDIKKEWLIKGIQMEGWRKVGSPIEFAKKYAEEGADELLLLDVVASLYERNSLHNIVEQIARDVFIPMTIGGGVRSLENVHDLMACGADKIAINTAATKEHSIISKLADRFGSQAVVVNIEAKKYENSWLAMTDNGRNHTGLDVINWAIEAQQRGAGELIITSIDNDGTSKGLDIDLIKGVCEAVSIPVIATGGLGSLEHFRTVQNEADISGLGIASALHWERLTLENLRGSLRELNCYVREL